MIGLETLLNDVVQHVLKHAGFKRKGYVWNRERDRLVDVIEIQLGKASHPGREQFTINAGVFVPEFYDLVWQKKHSGFAREVDCAVRGRVGEIIQNNFVGKALDKWWHLKSDQDYADCSSEIPKILTDSVLPFIERHKSITDVHAFLSTRGSWQGDFPVTKIYLALAKRELGEKEAAEHIIQAIIKGKSRAWADRARLVDAAVSLSSAKSPSVSGATRWRDA